MIWLVRVLLAKHRYYLSQTNTQHDIGCHFSIHYIFKQRVRDVFTNELLHELWRTSHPHIYSSLPVHIVIYLHVAATYIQH